MENIIDNSDDRKIEETEGKEVSFSVKMTAGIMYDYLIKHAYSGASGILGTCFGLLGCLFFARTGFVLYLIIGVMLILYLPVTLWTQASKAVINNEVYKTPLVYTLGSEGINVSQGEVSETASWQQCTKAVSTRQSIIVYTGKRNAFVFPRKQLNDKISPLIAVIAENMDPKKVKIRF